MRVAGIGKLPCRKCMGGGQTADTGTVRQAGASVILGEVYYLAWRSPQLNVTGSADRTLGSSASAAPCTKRRHCKAYLRGGERNQRRPLACRKQTSAIPHWGDTHARLSSLDQIVSVQAHG